MSVSRGTLAPVVSRETDRLKVFVDLLQAWNKKINLVSRQSAMQLWPRHIEDSLQLIPLIPAGTNCAIDLGSGAGFPGLVIAIATGIPVTLIEADGRKAAFLREAIRITSASATVLAVRIESATVPPAQLITARALAPLPKLLQLAVPFLTPNGTMLLLKGAGVELELAAARPIWTMNVERHISRTSKDGVVLRITGVQRA